MPHLLDLIRDRLRTPRARRLTRGSATVFGLRMLAIVIGYGLQLLLVHWMGISEYGRYIYVLAWTPIGALLLSLGLPQALIRFIPQYRVAEAPAALRGLLQRAHLLVGLAGVGVALLGTGFVASLQPDGVTLYVLALWLVPLLALNDLHSAAFQAVHRMGWAYLPETLRRVSVGLGAGVVIGMTGTLDAAQALLLTLAANALLLVVRLVPLRRHLGSLVRHVAARYETKSWLRVALPLLVLDGFRLISVQTDIILLGLLLAEEDVSRYFIALKTAAFIRILQPIINAVVAPEVAALYASGDTERLRRTVTYAVRLYFWPALAGVATLALLGGPILSLFGREFVEARWVLLVLALGYLVNLSTGSVGTLLNMTGHQDRSVRVYAEAALLNVALNVVLIPLLGTMGAALATATAMGYANLRLHRIVQRVLRIDASILARPSNL